MLQFLEFSIFLYKVENDVTNHISQYEENRFCNIFLSASKCGKKQFPIIFL